MTRKRIWIIEDDRNRCGEASIVAKMLEDDTTLTGIGTGTPEQEINSGQAVPVPL